jgi:hypothetical protein
MNNTTHKAFGWRIEQVSVPAGGTFESGIRVDTPKGQLVDRTLYVKGRATGVHSNGTHSVKPRVPGFYVDDLPDVLPRGTIKFTATSDLEWFCINYGLNNRRLPNVQKVHVVAGGSVELPVGARLFICSGEGTIGTNEIAPCSTVTVEDSPKTLLARTDVFAFQFL